ncbi:sensor histidine kinase [Stieleria varia]|uniref:sensor histidine kinase n=1 Tax=Stieleria varia TaxID=2528005 RepID=UPI001E431BA1|nr:PAS domain-containing sensor histidine kinase [Stieleria varia]
MFASLAILSIYRDWKILISATLVVAFDHAVRGVWYPASAFGIFTASPYRWIEHAAWVLFEVAFLAPGCYRLRNEVRELCVRQTEIEIAKKDVDRQVKERTRELNNAYELLEQQTAEANKLSMVAKYTDNAVVITDAKSTIEWVNAGYTRMTGYSLKEVQGRRPAEFLHGPQTDQATIDMVRDAVKNRQGINTEIINYRKNGEPFWLAMEVRPISNAEGDIDRFIAIQSDITQRKRMELSLADAEAQLRSTINSVPGAIYRREFDPVTGKKITFASEYIEQLTGYGPEKFVGEEGMSLLDLVHPDDLKRVTATLEQAIRSRCEFEHEYRIVDRQNNVRWIAEKGQCNAAVDGSSIILISGALFDVTKRIVAEQENQQLHAELVDASRQAGMAEIATGVLHNVGNILNSVNVSASVIRRQFSKSALANLEKVSQLIAEHESTFDDFVRDDERGRKVPAYVRKVTDALCSERETLNREFDELVNNVEHIKEIVSMQQSMAKSSGLIQELDARDLIREALSANKDSLANHHIPIEEFVDDGVPLFWSDKHRILQILVNLIKNAKDAIKEHKGDHPCIKVSATTDNQFVVFRVSDNGIGISANKRDKIFQHGFTTKKNGHGFGLHSSANAATEMGGKLTVHSDGDGTGATFELRVPSKPVVAKPVAANTNDALQRVGTVG